MARAQHKTVQPFSRILSGAARFFRSSENGRPRLKSARAWAKILWRVLSCASNLLGPQRKHTQMQVRKDDLNKDYLGMGSLPALF
eukprot:scaffold177535_cov15-Tisochrysis_lutea.AAC.1